MAFDHPAQLNLSKITVPDTPRLSSLELDRAFLEDALHFEDGEIRVAAHHRSIFHSQYLAEIEAMVQNLSLVKEHVRSHETPILALSKLTLRTDELLKQEQEGAGRTSWRGFDVGVALGLGLFSLVLLGMAVNTLATYLVDSGFTLIVKRPALAYLFSALNIALAVALKVGFSWCRDDLTKYRYFAGLWGAGLLTGLLWLVTFAIIFPDIGAQGVDEIIAGLGRENGLREAILEGIFVCSQLISEICISAALWIHLERMDREHAPSLVMETNPEHRGYLGRLSEWSERRRVAVAKRALLEGRLKEFQAAESAYLSKATTAFVALRRVREAGRYGLGPEAGR